MDEESAFKKFAPLLLNPQLTSRLRKEVEDAIAAHEGKGSPSTQDLQLVRQTLTRHWDKDHQSMIGFANDQWYLTAFALTMSGLLVLDYISENLSLDDLPLAERVLSYGDGQQRVQQHDRKGFAEIVAKDEAMLKQFAVYNKESREMQKIFPQLVQANLETKPTEPKSRLSRIFDRFRKDKI